MRLDSRWMACGLILFVITSAVPAGWLVETWPSATFIRALEGHDSEPGSVSPLGSKVGTVFPSTNRFGSPPDTVASLALIPALGRTSRAFDESAESPRPPPNSSF